jgi:hypothetical protein
MELELKGIAELRQTVDDMREVGTRLGMFAKTMMMAADKMDEALSAHIQAMDTHASRLEALNGLSNTRTQTRELGQAG